ncbi:MAG TPA: DUF885 domain-containing protein [Verrucomicrobiae bacterium]|nr:DUF885 domain-containing protein [Verrucomicrobiae bacterium]
MHFSKLIVITASVWVATGGTVLGQDADGQLNTFFRKHLDVTLRQRPVDATALGDHRYDNLLDDISKEARAGWLKQTRATLKELPKQVDYKKLSRAGQVDYEIFKQDLERDIWLTENFRPFEEDPRTYGRYISDSVYQLLTQSTLPAETNVANCIARMKEIPRAIATAKQTLTRPPKQHLETAIRQNRGAISFYETEIFELAAAALTNAPGGSHPSPLVPLPVEGRGKLVAELKSASGPVVAALKDYQQFLEKEVMPRATGEWRIGKKKFAKKLELVLDAGMTADQVLADAEVEYARVRQDMYMVSRQLWSQYFPRQALPPDDENGRRETIAKVIAAVSQEHGKPEDLLKNTQATVAEIKKFIRERNILALPEPDLCQVVEMPEFKRGNSIAYMENAPPLDPKAASIYAISPPPSDWDAAKVKSYLEEYNEHMLQILTIHEAYPGHYVQLEYANRNPSLIRRVLSSGVYVEGWAVYTEQTMLDQGYGERDLRLRLMQQKFYLRAVVNTILDHKMHCQNMTDDEAMKLMVDGAFQSEGEARLKVIRAKQSSTQLSTYFVGRMAHYRLRQSVEREMGDKFTLASFHEAVLNEGSIPVKYLPEVVRTKLQRDGWGVSNQPRGFSQ